MEKSDKARGAGDSMIKKILQKDTFSALCNLHFMISLEAIACFAGSNRASVSILG